MAGDGLRRPVNAPDPRQAAPGIQPGTSSGVVVAHFVIVTGTGGGVFVYSGAPALGNLAESVTGASVTDRFGNLALAGVTSYGPDPSGSGVIASNMNAGIFTNWTAATEAGPWTLQSQLPNVQSDTTAFTSAAITPTKISKVWPVAANDAGNGTIYRLTVFGTGQWGSPAQTLTFFLSAFGQSITFNTAGAAAMTPGATFGFKVTVELQVVSVGGGNASVTGDVMLTNESAVTVLQAGTLAYTTYNAPSGLTFGSASNITLQAEWGSVTGAPTLTGFGSIFERLGQAP